MHKNALIQANEGENARVMPVQGTGGVYGEEDQSEG